MASFAVAFATLARAAARPANARAIPRRADALARRPAAVARRRRASTTARPAAAAAAGFAADDDGDDARLLAKIDGETVACVVSKAEVEATPMGEPCYRGYIGMLAVQNDYRRSGIGTALVCRSIERMRAMGCDEVMLETEVTNKVALGLYEKLGFARDERLFKYYLNGVDAFRLKLWFR